MAETSDGYGKSFTYDYIPMDISLDTHRAIIPMSCCAWYERYSGGRYEYQIDSPRIPTTAAPTGYNVSGLINYFKLDGDYYNGISYASLQMSIRNTSSFNVTPSYYTYSISGAKELISFHSQYWYPTFLFNEDNGVITASFLKVAVNDNYVPASGVYKSYLYTLEKKLLHSSNNTNDYYICVDIYD